MKTSRVGTAHGAIQKYEQHTVPAIMAIRYSRPLNCDNATGMGHHLVVFGLSHT